MHIYPYAIANLTKNALKTSKKVCSIMLSIDFDIFLLRETKVASKRVSLKGLRNGISLLTQNPAYFLVYRNTHSPVIWESEKEKKMFDVIEKCVGF